MAGSESPPTNKMEISAGLNAVKSRTFQYVVLGVIVLLIVYYFYNQGKKNGESTKLPELPLPNNGQGIPAQWQQNTAIILVDNLNSALGWFVLPNTKSAVYNKCLALTDDQLTYVYNLYNAKYGNANGASLTVELNKFVNYVTEGSRDKLVTRLENLKLP